MCLYNVHIWLTIAPWLEDGALQQKLRFNFHLQQTNLLLDFSGLAQLLHQQWYALLRKGLLLWGLILILKFMLGHNKHTYFWVMITLCFFMLWTGHCCGQRQNGYRLSMLPFLLMNMIPQNCVKELFSYFSKLLMYTQWWNDKTLLIEDQCHCSLLNSFCSHKSIINMLIMPNIIIG